MKRYRPKPIKLAEWLLEILLFRAVDFGAMADYDEEFCSLYRDKGMFYAHFWYVLQIAIAVPGFLHNTLYWSLTMLKNYIKIAFRNLRKQKIYTLINLTGMAVGMIGFAIFAHVAGVKLNADRFHKNADNIYGVISRYTTDTNEEKNSAFLPGPVMESLQNEYPEIISAARILAPGRLIFRNKDNAFYENRILLADPDFFSIFSFPFLQGDAQTALSQPNSIVITENMAVKYFGKDNPLGKDIFINKDIKMMVTGVLRGLPRTSSLRFDCIGSLHCGIISDKKLNSWKDNPVNTFILLKDHKARTSLEAKLGGFTGKYLATDTETKKSLYLFPFLDFRLNSSHIKSLVASSPWFAIIIIFSLSIILLLVVCINFMNLTIARYLNRTKEVGMRKVIGARRFQLMRQFLGESIILSFLALPFAIIGYEFIHPLFDAYIGNISNIPNSIFNYPFLLKYLVFAALLTGLVSGFYPSLILSAFKPAQILKNNSGSGRRKNRGQKIMIIFQFTSAIFFIMLSGLVKTQMNNYYNSDLGYSRENVAILNTSGEARANIDILKKSIGSLASVDIVSASSHIPIDWSNKTDVRPSGARKENAFAMEEYPVDYGFFRVFNMRILQGRPFSRETGDKNAIVINETAARKLNLAEPVGAQITIKDKTYTVIGMVKDFIFTDYNGSISPAVFRIGEDESDFLFIRYLSGTDFDNLSKTVRAGWMRLSPELPFDFRTMTGYMDEQMDLIFRMANLLNMIGLLAIFFSCLGLLGIASYMVRMKTKEIGIRKILGAPTFTIMWSLIKKYLLLVVISNVIALSVFHIVWDRIVREDLVFMTNISISSYLFAFIISLSAAVFAVVTQTFRAVYKNPADTLRYE